MPKQRWNCGEFAQPDEGEGADGGGRGIRVICPPPLNYTANDPLRDFLQIVGASTRREVAGHGKPQPFRFDGKRSGDGAC